MDLRSMDRQILILFIAAIPFSLPLNGSAQNEEGKKEEKASEKESAPRPASDLDVSEKEVKKLVRIDKKLRSIQIRGQKKLQKNIQESGISRQRYGEIRRAQRSGDNPDMTEKEKKQMEALKKKNERTQKRTKAKMKKKVQAEGMSFDRYRELRKAVSRRPELRSRYRKHMKAMQKKERGKSAPKKEESPKK
jgi:hypothetical protein